VAEEALAIRFSEAPDENQLKKFASQLPKKQDFYSLKPPGDAHGFLK